MPERISRRKLLASTAVASTVGLSGCQSVSFFTQEQSTSGSIHVPTLSTVGTPIPIRLSGFESNSVVRLEATATDARDITFRKTWSLRTDDSGRAGLSSVGMTRRQPASTWAGTKNDLRAAGQSESTMLLQSLRSATGSPTPSSFIIGTQTSVDLTLTAYVDFTRSPVVTQSTTRVYISPGVTRRSIAADDLVGWLYLPPTSGPHPAVITLHGSAAYVPHVFSRMLASHGYATLALQYFGADGLPDSLSGIPLEYFQRAIRWLTTQQAVRDDGVRLVGFSRGVEPALLAAADYEGPATVVGYSGSGVIAQEYPPRGAARSAWVRNGKPVAPYSAISAVFSSIRSVYQHDCEIASVRDRVLEEVSATTLERALIPVEKITGPVLLFASGDDQLWPAPPLSVLAINRLTRHGHSYPYGLRVFCDAGHVFHAPYQRYTGRFTNNDYGGAPTANARAAAFVWPALLACLNRGL